MPLDINVTVNPGPDLLSRLASMEGEMNRMSDQLTELTNAVNAEEAQSAQIVQVLGALKTEIDQLHAAGGGATAEQIAALASRLGAVTQAEAAAVAAVPAEDLPPASPPTE